MTKKITFVADFFANQVNGGGELNNEEAILLLEKNGYSVQRMASQDLSPKSLLENKSDFYIVANFIGLGPICKDIFVQQEYRYVIYEHDHKYLKTRDPSHFQDYRAPKNQIINQDFYSSAIAVFCQSKMHKQVVEKNLKTKNIVNLGGNLWSEDTLSFLSSLAKKTKQERYSIWDSYNPIKSTAETIAFCTKRNIPYQLVGNLPHNNFLDKLSNNNTFIFLPKTLETLCRVVVEARMCGMKVVTNNKVGATSEEWFSLKGLDLIEKMRSKRTEIYKKIEETIK